MLKKLKLDLTSRYESAIAASEIANMLIAFIGGRTHFISIGSEQGIEKWDDFIIEHEKNTYEHIQVKQQNHSFSIDETLDTPHRGTYTKKPRIGQPRDLSALDKSMKSLGACFNSMGAIDRTAKHTFTLIVPHLLVEAKNGLTLLDLHDFCANHITPSTDPTKLQDLITASSSAKKVVTWLEEWCGFTDDAQIVHALKAFTVKQKAQTSDIDTETKLHLSSCFTQPAIALERIYSYISANTSYISAITPRPILLHLLTHLLPESNRWTQFRNRSGTEWEISGTHGGTVDDIENASSVVPALWSMPSKGIVKYHSQASATGKLPMALVRLMLHLKPTSVAHISNASNWSQTTKSLIGNTLGLNEWDCNDLSIEDDNNDYSSSEARVLTHSLDHDNEANRLSDEMHRKTWDLICEALLYKIQAMGGTELHYAIETRWQDWKKSLDADVPKQKEICKSMLHPAAEGEEIQAELRIGPKTVPLLVDGFYWLLIIAVCFNDSPNSWDIIDGQTTIKVKALCYWSGPAGQRRWVRKIDDEGIEKLLGKEKSKILILSKVDATLSDILDNSLAEDISETNSIASGHRPTLVITNSPKFRRAIRKGVITEIRDIIQEEFEKIKSSKLITS